MRQILAIAAISALLLCPSAYAQQGQTVIPGYRTTVGCPNGQTSCFVPGEMPGPRTPLGYFQTASFSVATSLPSVPSTATMAVIECTAAVNYRDDGTAPTATVGMPLAASTYLPYTASATAMVALQIIPQSGSAVCNVLYYS